jgi:hypothetical protein
MAKLTQDKVLEVLQGHGRGKRAPRYGRLDVYLREGAYLIQAGGVTLADKEGTRDDAIKDAKERAERMLNLTGKPVVITVY